LLMLIVSFSGFSQDMVSILHPDHQNIQYYGRFDQSNPKLPRFWAAGSMIVTRFSGGDCEVFLNDQVYEGASHNYIEVKVDNIDPVRIQLRAKTNRIQIAKDLPGGDHTVTITKNTDASVGYLELRGFKCNSLLPPPPVPSRKIEFIGDDIMAGVGGDSTYAPCDSENWYEQSTAYHGYAVAAARQLQAQYYMSAVNGIGLRKGGGEANVAMPLLYDKIDQNKDKIEWDFRKFQPDVVVIGLGANDALTDSAGFANAYISFLKTVRQKNPSARIVCVAVKTGRQGSGKLTTMIPAMVAAAKNTVDARIDALVINGMFNKGCNGYPHITEQLQISMQLNDYLKKLMAW
ncbi:MAG: GDSL-type esterase/lipase family protein, partial [Flavitalea sp.]